MVTTLIKRVQNDNTLSKEEKNKRVCMLFDWWEKYGKKLQKVNKKLYNLHIKNKQINFKLLLNQKGYYNKLILAFKGLEKSQIFNSSNDIDDYFEKESHDNSLFIKKLIQELMKN